MNEHEKDTETGSQVEALPVVASEGVEATPSDGDLVVDLTGIRELDVANLSILLTTQQQAQGEDRVIWLAGVPFEVWRTLHQMGLGGYFRPFPISGEVSM